jgi:hypothetical protein
MRSKNPFAPKVSSDESSQTPSNDEEGGKFHSEFWEPRFKEPTFVLPTNPPATGKSGVGAASVPPKKTASTPNVARTRASSTANNAPPPHVETVVIEDSPTPPARRSPAPAQEAAPPPPPDPFSPDTSGDAMDIDTDEILPPAAQSHAEPPVDRAPRNVQVPTSRPEWGDVRPAALAVDPQLQATPRRPSGTMRAAPTPSMPSLGKKRVPPPVTPAAAPPATPAAVPRTDPSPTATAGPAPTSPTSPHLGRAKSTLNLSSLRPSLSADYPPPDGGLPSFLSQPSPRHPSAPPPGPLALPRVPVPPAAPASRRLSLAAWRAHVAAMSAYMGEWWAFEDRVLRHLDARHGHDARFGRGVPSTSATRLLEAQGEPGGQGVEAYVEARLQDRRVREGWMAACDRHERCVGEFAATKRRVKAEGFAAG